MGRRTRILTGIIILLAAISIVGGVYLTDIKSNQSTVTAWQVIQKVSTGERFSSQNVEMVQIQSTDRSILSVSPNGEMAIHNVAAGDILRNDDVTQASSQVEVLLTLQSAPATNSGDLIDVYTPVGSDMVLIGKHLLVVGGGGSGGSNGGSGVTVMVPAPNEGYWLSLISSGTKLYAAIAGEPLSIPCPAVSQGSSISQLSGINPSDLPTTTIVIPASVTPSATATPSTSATPSATPTGTGIYPIQLGTPTVCTTTTATPTSTPKAPGS